MKTLLVLLVLSLAAACTNDTAPDVVQIEGKTPYLNVERLRVTWGRMEACSNLQGDFSKMKFYTASKITYNGNPAGGYWFKGTNEIVVSDRVLADSGRDRIFDHEIMHALLNHGGHPILFFDGLCGDLLHNVWE